MKAIWIEESLHETYSKASEKVGRSLASVVQIILTKNINLANNQDELNKLFNMVKKEK